MANAGKLILAAIVGGVVLGILAGSAIPTALKEAPEQAWRKNLEARAASPDTSYRFVETGPADLDPRPGLMELPEFALDQELAEEELTFDRAFGAETQVDAPYDVMAEPLPEPRGHGRFQMPVRPPPSLTPNGKNPGFADRAAIAAEAALEAAHDVQAAEASKANRTPHTGPR